MLFLRQNRLSCNIVIWFDKLVEALHLHRCRIIVRCRARFMERRFRYWREYYHGIVVKTSYAYSVDETTRAVRKRIGDRHPVSRKQPGEVHTLAFVPMLSWHRQLLEGLSTLGAVSLCDYQKLGIKAAELYTARNSSLLHRMNELAFAEILKIHAQRPVDWIFFYARGDEVSLDFLSRIHDKVGVPLVNMCLDSKHAWTGVLSDAQYTGQKSLVPHFDLYWTTSRTTCEWIAAEGGRPVYLPEGANPVDFRPQDLVKDIDVSFIGQRYGYRANLVDFLQCKGVKVEAFGSGWNNGSLSEMQIPEVIHRSKICLGLGGIGYSEEITNLKNRDFDIPMCGGGVYLTSYNSDLAQHFCIGKEVLCYKGRDELIELIRYYLAHEEEAAEISQAGRKRCLSEHTWHHRFSKICEIIGII